MMEMLWAGKGLEQEKVGVLTIQVGSLCPAQSAVRWEEGGSSCLLLCVLVLQGVGGHSPCPSARKRQLTLMDSEEDWFDWEEVRIDFK